MKITAVLCVRNEGAFLLDWLAHHLACGVTHVVALSNDCDDGTDALLDRLDALGHVTHIRNDGPYDKGGIQFTGLKLADKSAAVREADWLLALANSVRVESCRVGAKGLASAASRYIKFFRVIFRTHSTCFFCPELKFLISQKIVPS